MSENVKTPDDVAVNSCMRHVSIQTGEEFSAEFLRERKSRLEIQTSEESFQGCHQDRNKPSKTVVTSADLPQELPKNCPIEFLRDHGAPTTPPTGVPYNRNQQFVYKDASGSGISKKDPKYGIDLSNSFQHKDHTSKGYHQHQQQSVYTNEIYNDQAGFCPTSSSHHKSNSPQAYQQYSYVTGKLKFLCSFGGKILPRPGDGKLRYVGGETRIISIRKNINYQALMKKTSAICNHPHTIKYQLPDEDLDALISVCSDEDFHHMIEEYHELEKGSKRLRIFLVSLIEPENPSSYDSMPVQQTGIDYTYVVAVNGITEPSLSKSSSKENLEGGAMDFNPNFQQNSPLMDIGATSSNSMKTLRNPTQFIQTPSKLMMSNILTTSSHMPVQLTDPTNPQMIACRENKQYSLLDENMIKWMDTNNPNLIFEENQYANKHSITRTASSDRFSNLSSRLQHNAENSVLLTTSGESDCVLRSNLNKNNPGASDSEIPFSALFTPNSSDFSVVESSEDNLSLTLDDKNSDDIPEIPVLVEEVTDNLPFDVPSYRKVVPYVQEEPSDGVFTPSDMEAGSVAQSDIEDGEDGNRVKDELISGATIAQMEAGIYGVQIIKNADLQELRELGSGTFGTVYHGKWRGSDVAIKRIRKSCFAGKSSEQERLTKDFWREAHILSKLHHPNVVALYGVVPDGPGGTLSTVTEYMANGSLRHVLSRNNRALDWRKKLMIAQDAAIGMEYLHLKNIVHFDLKCENLLVNLGDPQRPVCKVGDFGLSRIKRNTFVSGGVRGTLPWMAPELLYGGNNRVSEKVDVFSFGIAMWEILTEEEPYADMHCGAIIGGILSNTLRPPIPTRCDSRWKALMEECWSHYQEDRPSFTQITNKLQVMSMSLHSKTQNA